MSRRKVHDTQNQGISQWFPEKANKVADALSRDMDRSDNELTQILFTHVPSQVPSSFKIVSLPSKIVSRVTSLLLKLPVQRWFNEEHTMTTLGRGNNGTNTATIQDSPEISSSPTSPKRKNPHFQLFCHGCLWREIFKTKWCSPGCWNSQEYHHQQRGSGLQASQIRKSHKRHWWSIRLELSTTVPSIQKRWTKRNSTKSDSYNHHKPHRKTSSNRNPKSYRATHRWGLLLGM